MLSPMTDDAERRKMISASRSREREAIAARLHDDACVTIEVALHLIAAEFALWPDAWRPFVHGDDEHPHVWFPFTPPPMPEPPAPWQRGAYRDQRRRCTCGRFELSAVIICGQSSGRVEFSDEQLEPPLLYTLRRFDREP